MSLHLSGDPGLRRLLRSNGGMARIILRRVPGEGSVSSYGLHRDGVEVVVGVKDSALLLGTVVGVSELSEGEICGSVVVMVLVVAVVVLVVAVVVLVVAVVALVVAVVALVVAVVALVVAVVVLVAVVVVLVAVVVALMVAVVVVVVVVAVLVVVGEREVSEAEREVEGSIGSCKDVLEGGEEECSPGSASEEERVVVIDIIVTDGNKVCVEIKAASVERTTGDDEYTTVAVCSSALESCAGRDSVTVEMLWGVIPVLKLSLEVAGMEVVPVPDGSRLLLRSILRSEAETVGGVRGLDVDVPSGSGWVELTGVRASEGKRVSVPVAEPSESGCKTV